MLGFTQTAPNNIKGFSGFTCESLSNVIVIVKDEKGKVVPDAFVVLNSTFFLTNSLGVAEFELTSSDPYTVSAIKIGYNTYIDSGTFTGGTLLINAIITLAPGISAQGTGGDILWSPVCNSFRFFNSQRNSFYDNQSQDDLSKKPFMFGADYCQKVQAGERIYIRIHSNASTVGDNSMTLRDYVTGNVVATLAVPTVLVSDLPIKDTLGNSFTYDILEFAHTFQVFGNYFLRLERSDTGQFMDSEPITVGDFPNTLLLDFQNYKSDDQVGTTANPVGVRIEAQLYKRIPSGTKTTLQTNDKSSINTSQRNFRGMTLETFGLPPYLHECLAYGFSLSQCTIKGAIFYSESGYENPIYFDRYNLANGTVDIMTQRGFNQGEIGIHITDGLSLIQSDGDQLIQDNGDTLITIQ